MKNNNQWLFAKPDSKQSSVCWCLVAIALTAWLLPAISAVAQEVAAPETKAEKVEPKKAEPDKPVEGQPVEGQPDTPPSAVVGSRVVFEDSVNTRWKIGAVIKTGSGRATNVFMTFPVPSNWPEQTVTIAEEDIPASIGNVTSRTLPAGVEQVVAQFPVVPANDVVVISYTLDIVNRAILPPPEPQVFVLPRRGRKEVKPFLAASKNVNYQNGKLRKMAKQLVEDHESAWDKTEAIYNWVRENIQVEETSFHSAQHTLKNLSGTNEDKTFLFIALCRAAKIPSRIVFAKGTSYAEFMLQGPGEDNPLHWFPCDVSGVREFGELSEPRVILQKGDGMKVPEKKHAQKYVAEFIKCSGTVKPRVGFFRSEIFEDEEE